MFAGADLCSSGDRRPTGRRLWTRQGRFALRSLACAAFALAVPALAAAGTHRLGAITDLGSDTTVPVTDLPMMSIATSASQGGNDATDTTVSIGGTVAPADVAKVSVYYGGALVGSVTNPSSLSNIVISLPGNQKGGSPWEFRLDLNASAGGKTFSLTVSSITGTDNAGLPASTATYTATPSGCTHAAPTVTIQAPTSQTGCAGATVQYSFTVTNNCSAACGDETFSLSYDDSAWTGASSGPASVTLAPGATSSAQTLSVTVGASGSNDTTITASLAGHTDGFSNPATTSADTTPPPAASFTLCDPVSSSEIDLTFTNPEAGVLVVRGPAGSCPTFQPSDGTSYGTGPQGSDQIIFAGAGTSVADTGLTANTSYCYEIWAYDGCFNYAAPPPGTTSCSTPAAGNTAPTISATKADDGTGNTVPDLTTCSGNDVTLSASIDDADGDPLSWTIWVDDGGGWQACGTGSESVLPATVQCTITGIATTTQYYVEVDDGTVTVVDPTGAPTTTHTVTVDTTPPAPASFSDCSGVSSSQIDLTFTNPETGVLVVRGPAGGTCPTFSPVDGTQYGVGPQGSDQIVFAGGGTAFSDTGLNPSTTYCYEVWAYDPCFNYATSPGTTSCSTLAGGTATATLRSDGKDASDDGVWSWTGTELGDVNDATVATNNAVGTLRSTIENKPDYQCKVISQITVYIRIAKVGGAGDEQVDFGVVNGGTEYLTGTPFEPAQDVLTDYSFVLPTRPWDGGSWTPADIDNLVVTVPTIRVGGKYQSTFNLAEIWVDVEYDPGSNTCATLTVGEGSDPGDALACPGGGAVDLDGFTLQLDTGSAPVSAIEVTFAPGTSAAVGTVEITDTSDVVLGSTSSVADVTTVPVAGLTATTTVTPYKVKITPASHASIPAATVYSVTGNVSNVTVNAAVVDDDAASATIAVDNEPPADATWGTITPGNGEVTLSWTNPIDSDFAEVVIVRSTTTPIGAAPTDGVTYTTAMTIGGLPVVYVGSGTSFTDTGLANGTTYYYKIFARDGCVNYAPGTETGPVTPYDTSQTSPDPSQATIDSCKQATVTALFTGDENDNGSTRVEYDTTSDFSGSPSTSCGKLTGRSPRQCIVAGLAPGTSYWFRITYEDPDGIAGASQEIIGPYATPACGTDTAPPVLLLLSPRRDSVIGGTERVKVQVYDEGGLATADPVQWSVDGGAFSASPTVNANYDCGPGCAIYEFDLDTTGLSDGEHYLTVQATDLEGNVARRSWPLTVNNSGTKAAGDGFLLRRSHGSQLCRDCHNLKTHSSQHSSTKYGTWALDCLTCHTPHNTTNLHLIREVIRTPNSGAYTVKFHFDDRTGDTNPGGDPSDNPARLSYLGDWSGADNAPYDDGICEVCHTRTTAHTNDTVAGGDHTHNVAQRCTKCHLHKKGFTGPPCDGCHYAPPTVGKHGVHDEVGSLPTKYDTTASHATTTQYGFPCAKCHSGTHLNDSAHGGGPGDPYQVEVSFDTTSPPSNPGGVYSGTYNENTDTGPNGETWSWSDGTCSNLYCHSDAKRTSPTYATVTWNQGTSLTCTSCHDNAAGGSTNLSAAHTMHAVTYGYGCVRCHSGTVGSAVDDVAPTAVADKTRHVNGVRDVVFDGSGVDNSGGSYDDTGATCSNIYCHSNGQDRTAPYTSGPSIAWTTTATCTSCHDTGGAGTTLSGAHQGHTNANSPTKEGFGCVQCHSDTVSDNSTISNRANHVNGVADVLPTDYDTSTGTFTPGASEGTGSCSNLYCHSDGLDPTANPPVITYHNPAWNESPPGGDVCRMCHGRASGVAGAPDHANGGAGAPNANSHPAHVGSASDCITCHNATVTAAGSITNPANHIDGNRQVVFDPANPNTASASYDPSTKTCSGLGTGCHGPKQWGGPSLVCLDCHGDATTDTDDYVYGNGTVAKVAEDEWAYSGHGRSSGTYDVTGNPAANFGGPNPCLYCHDPGVGHGSATNPFRLRNIGAGATADDWAGNCLACHGTGSTGVDPDGAGGSYANINSALKINAYHFGPNHPGATSGDNGGKFCWDCHDPHGDRDAGGGNILMIHDQVSQKTDGTYGVPQATRPAFMIDNTTLAGFVDRDTDPPPGDHTKYTKICNTCHTAGDVNNFTSTSGSNHQETYTGGTCTTECHPHDQPPNSAFAKPQGGPLHCTNSACHGSANSNARRDVSADFTQQSHHVYDAGWDTSLNPWDCIVCHAEATDTGGQDPEANGTLHTNGLIELWNADGVDTGGGKTYYVYDVDAIRADAGTDMTQWSSANATWVAQTSTNLDPFCLSCHDADGATATFNSHDSGTALNPFGDSQISNSYDQVDRTRVTDIRSKVDAVGFGNVDRDQTGEPRGPDGIPDPPEGIYARHAIRGFSQSPYTTPHPNWSNGAGGNTYWNTGTYAWDETKVMGCADCHTVDGANGDGSVTGTVGNAHGSQSEYLLKDKNGTANEGTLAGSNYVCYRCHSDAFYKPGTGHTGNASDWQDYTGSTGSARIVEGNTGGNIYGMACGNCHGGAGFGTIHGTSQVLGVGQNGGSGTRQAYRFTNGNSMRYYDPQGWTGSTSECFTLSSQDAPWGGCTKHSRGSGSRTKVVVRPLSY